MTHSQATGSGPSMTDSSADDPSIKDKAAESAQAGKQGAADVAQTAAEKAKDVTAEAAQQTRNVLSQARSQVKEQAATQHRSLVDNLRTLGDQLDSMAGAVDQPGMARDLVSQAGDRAHTAASWLDQREPGQLLDEVRNLARRRPGAFLAGALIAGVAAGRLTRGAVAAHSDGAQDGGQQGESADGRQQYAGTGYAQGSYGQGGYGQSSPGVGLGTDGTDYSEPLGYQQTGSRRPETEAFPPSSAGYSSPPTAVPDPYASGSAERLPGEEIVPGLGEPR